MPRKRSNSAAIFAEATSTAEAIHQQDQVAEERAERDRAQRINLPLPKIQPRAEDSRPLDERHVANLVESIGALGLIEPLVVDIKGVLIAGGHRLAAIQVLKQSTPNRYAQSFPDDLVPVRVMPFEAKAEPERALQVELAENEKRVNYSRDQIELLAVRLRALNYRETRGRPKEGEKALGPALAVAIGVSTRYVRRVLSGLEKDHSENRNSVPILSKAKTLRKIEASLEELLTLPESEQMTRADRALLKAVPGFLAKLRASFEANSR
jgi:ParB family transcriptional regulator, chromosome partitioning protein